MVVEKGYAKINLGLEVIKKRDDGFHDLSMVMTTIDLYDELYFEENLDSNQFIIDCDRLEHIEIESNLIYKAYITLKEKFDIKKGVKVKVIKRIPEQAGLAGGSADCAATLRGLNLLWKLNLSLEELAKIGESLGSDVPFCVFNKSARVTSRGEKIEFIEEIPFAYIVLVFPNFKSSTKEVFNNFKIHSLNKGKIETLLEAIDEGDINKLSQNLFNDLEYSSKQFEIYKIKKDMLRFGALGSVMSGSGSTVYGICLKEKHAQMIANKLSHLYKHLDYKVLVSSIHSFRNPILKESSLISNTNNKVLQTIETKAAGMLMLGYQNLWKSYKIILTPINLYDQIIIQKIERPICELYYDGALEEDKLSNYISRLTKELQYGLKIRINRKINRALGLMNNDIYLSSIITALTHFGADTDKLYSLYPKRVEAYKEGKTFFYDSKKDIYRDLGDAVFGYVIMAPLNINNYQSPRHTFQIDKNTTELDNIIEGIKTRNFYLMASNIYNGISKFEIRKIEDIKGYPYFQRLENKVLKNGATGCSISQDGKNLIAICRYEKQALIISNLLKDKFRLRDTIITTINSNNSHQSYKNPQLKQEYVEEIKELITEDISEDLLYQEFEIDNTSPFGEVEIEIDEYEEKTKQKSSYKKKYKQNYNQFDNDVEGILSVYSGGSLFKHYDFIDIAKYFEKYFHGESITFKFDDREISVVFNIEYLPHILGIHLLDDKNLALKGRSGFEKLRNGEVSFYQLKRSGAYKEEVVKAIFEKTQSAVLIFNDIYNARMYDISCFPKDVVLSENSKMKMLDFVIARKLTTTTYHKQNVLGIGKDPNSGKYFFYTSFLWDVPAYIGKKDSYKIGISR